MIFLKLNFLNINRNKPLITIRDIVNETPFFVEKAPVNNVSNNTAIVYSIVRHNNRIAHPFFIVKES